jgi:hypothetical protein
MAASRRFAAVGTGQLHTGHMFAEDGMCTLERTSWKRIVRRHDGAGRPRCQRHVDVVLRRHGVKLPT